MQTGGKGHSRLTMLIMGEQRSALERLLPDRYPRYLTDTIVRWLLILGAGVATSMVLIGSNLEGFRRTELAIVFGAVWSFGFIVRMLPDRLHLPAVSWMLLVIGPSVGPIVWLAGPNLAGVVALVPLWSAGCFVLIRRRTALIAALLAAVSMATMISVADGYPRPAAQIVYLVTILIAGGDIFLRFAHELRVVSERLEERVEAQGGEITRLGRLRRFLSPQVADTVVSEGADELLATHRRQIAVIFVDLRGFTGFSAVAEPEDVVDLLSEFFAAVGTNLKRLDATVGGFAGDSVMAYFNDPVPCEDPAGRAFDAAQSLKVPMEDLSERWRKRGFAIGYGVGIAYGYATLGIIGFEERNDYTPIGSVVNLASRLCDEAGPNELLLDGRAYEAVRDAVDAEDVVLTLKGFTNAVTAHRVRL